MNEPKVPDDVPRDGGGQAPNPAGKTPHGIPRGAEDAQPKAKPTSDREQTETAANKS